MADTVFRSQQTESAPETIVEASEPISVSSDNVEVPYTDAPSFLEDYFGIGTAWKDHDALFESDINKINEYVREKIDSGEVANSQKAVRDLLRGMEKVNNLTKEERAVVKLEVLANYSEFLSKNEKLKSNLRRYGNA